MGKILDIIKKKWLRDTTKTVILVSILLILFIGINLLVQKADLQDIDVTENKLYTISEETKNQLNKVEKEVNITVIGIEEDTSLVDLIKQYNKQNLKIKYEIISDIEQRPDIKQQYNITEESQLILVSTSEDNTIITTSELYTYDYTTYQQIDISEEKLTNAIVGLTIEEKPTIYFLTGHNEYSVSSHLTILKAYLENEVNNVQTLDLLVKNEVPEDASVIVIASPEKDFNDREVEILTNYINNGGKIIWTGEPELTGKEFPNIQKILDLFGVKIDNGIIIEQASDKIVLQTPNFIIPNITSTKATKDIATDGGIMLINSAKLSFVDDEKLEELNVTNQTILTTSQNALFRIETSNNSDKKISSDEEGKFTLGTKLTKQINDETESTMYIFANTLFITDYAISVGNSQMPAIYFYNNKDFILNTIADLTNREDTISIRKDVGVIQYTATEQEDLIVKIIIFAIPVIIILTGIIIGQIRKRKK